MFPRARIETGTDYLELISEGGPDITNYVGKAMNEVKKGRYPVSELRTALIKGLWEENIVFQEWIDEEGDEHWKSRIKENRELIAALEKGKEVVYFGTRIPA